MLPLCGVRYVECHRAGNDKYVGGMLLQDCQKNTEIFLIKLSQFHQAFRLQNLNRAAILDAESTVLGHRKV